MFTEFGKVVPNIRGKVKCVVILEDGEETVDWCSLAEIRQAVEAVEHMLAVDGACTHPHQRKDSIGQSICLVCNCVIRTATKA